MVLGAAATFLAFRDANDRLSAQDNREAALLATQLSGALQQLVAAPRGASAIAIDGVVTQDEFDAFAREAIADSAYPALAYAEVVTSADRAGFLQRTGLAITDTDGAGGFRPAVPRERSYVVTLVYPLNDNTRPVLGFDLASDPVRARAALAAESTSEPVISDRTTGATAAASSVSIMAAVRRADGEMVGVVTSGIATSSLLDAANVSAEDRTHVGLTMDGAVLIPGPSGGAERTFRVAGRQFVVRVDAPGGLQLLLPLIVAGGALALAAGVMISFRRDRRQRARLDLAARRSRGIADLGRRLAASSSAETIVDEVLRVAAAVLDAEHVAVARRRSVSPMTLEIAHDTTTDAALQSRFESVALSRAMPMTDCVRLGQLIGLRNIESILSGYPHLEDDLERGRVEATICAPLTLSDGTAFGGIGFVWSASMSPSELDERSVAVITIAELTSRAMERAFTAEVVQAGVNGLSVFARALATSYRDTDVVDAVHDHVASIVQARDAALTLVGSGSREEGDDVAVLDSGATTDVIRDEEGRERAVLVTHWGGATPGTTQQGVMETVTELISQTLARTALTDLQHEIVVRLQHDLLQPPPHIDGLEIAVTYRPAMSVVGLGGDFYDVIVSRSGEVHIVIGDVTGHGSEAVAVMAELKAVLLHLLSTDTPPDVSCRHADALLARRSYFATVQIASLAPNLDTLRIVNAGHPFPLTRREHGVSELIRSGHRPLLGLGTTTASLEVSEIAFDPDQLLLLYTDGLIERRRRTLDHAMADLCDAVDRDASRHGESRPLEHLLDDLVATTLHDTDDDIALIGVRRVGRR